MTYRFVLEEVHAAMVRVHDKRLDCTWVLPIQFYWCINSTEYDDPKNQEITEALYDNAINCIVSK